MDPCCCSVNSTTLIPKSSGISLNLPNLKQLIQPTPSKPGISLLYPITSVDESIKASNRPDQIILSLSPNPLTLSSHPNIPITSTNSSFLFGPQNHFVDPTSLGQTDWVIPENFPKVHPDKLPGKFYAPTSWTQTGVCQVGLHVNIDKTLLETVGQMHTFGCRCCQIYLSGRTNTEVRKVELGDLQHSEYQLLQNGQSLYVHAPLIVNIAQKWDDPKLFKGMKAVRDEVEMMWNLPASTVVHFGKGLHGGTIQSMAQVVNHLDLRPGYYTSNPYRLLLENDAGQGTSLIRTVEDYRKFYEVLDRSVIGLCLDTQHTFAGGMCNWSTHDQTIGFLEQIEEAVGTKSLSLFHLNDSATAFGSRHDKHANIGGGFIWGRPEYQEGLQSLLGYAKQKNLNMILETGIAPLEVPVLNQLMLNQE